MPPHAVGEDYHMANRRVDLISGVNEDSGQVKVKIVNDYLPEDDEELFETWIWIIRCHRYR